MPGLDEIAPKRQSAGARREQKKYRMKRKRLGKRRPKKRVSSMTRRKLSKAMKKGGLAKKIARLRSSMNAPIGRVVGAVSHPEAYVKIIVEAASKIENPVDAKEFASMFLDQSPIFTNTDTGLAALLLEATLMEKANDVYVKMVESVVENGDKTFTTVFQGKLTKEDLDSLDRETEAFMGYEFLVKAGTVDYDTGQVSDFTIIECAPKPAVREKAQKFLPDTSKKQSVRPVTQEDYQKVTDEGGISKQAFKLLYFDAKGMQAGIDEVVEEYVDHNGITWFVHDGTALPNMDDFEEGLSPAARDFLLTLKAYDDGLPIESMTDDMPSNRIVNEYIKRGWIALDGESLVVTDKAVGLEEEEDDDLDETVSPEQKEMKKRLSAFFKKRKLKVRYKSSSGKASYIGVWMRGAEFPAAIRNAAITAVYGKDFKRSEEQPVAGNIMVSSISMKVPEWDKFLRSLGEPVEEAVKGTEELGFEILQWASGGDILQQVGSDFTSKKMRHSSTKAKIRKAAAHLKKMKDKDATDLAKKLLALGEATVPFAPGAVISRLVVGKSTWKKAPKDYKKGRGKNRMMLRNTPKGTALVPVLVVPDGDKRIGTYVTEDESPIEDELDENTTDTYTLNPDTQVTLLNNTIIPEGGHGLYMEDDEWIRSKFESWCVRKEGTDDGKIMVQVGDQTFKIENKIEDVKEALDSIASVYLDLPDEFDMMAEAFLKEYCEDNGEAINDSLITPLEDLTEGTRGHSIQERDERIERRSALRLMATDEVTTSGMVGGFGGSAPGVVGSVCPICGAKSKEKQSASGGNVKCPKCGATMVGEAVEEGVPEKHQKKIAIRTLELSTVGAKVMGGMGHKQAIAFLRSAGWSDAKLKGKLKQSGWKDAEIAKLLKESLDERGKAPPKSGWATAALRKAHQSGAQFVAYAKEIRKGVGKKVKVVEIAPYFNANYSPSVVIKEIKKRFKEMPASEIKLYVESVDEGILWGDGSNKLVKKGQKVKAVQTYHTKDMDGDKDVTIKKGTKGKISHVVWDSGEVHVKWANGKETYDMMNSEYTDYVVRESEGDGSDFSEPLDEIVRPKGTTKGSAVFILHNQGEKEYRVAYSVTGDPRLGAQIMKGRLKKAEAEKLGKKLADRWKLPLRVFTVKGDWPHLTYVLQNESLDEAKFTDVTGSDPRKALIDAGIKSIEKSPQWKKASKSEKATIVSKMNTYIKANVVKGERVLALDLTKAGGGKFRMVLPKGKKESNKPYNPFAESVDEGRMQSVSLSGSFDVADVKAAIAALTSGARLWKDKGGYHFNTRKTSAYPKLLKRLKALGATVVEESLDEAAKIKFVMVNAQSGKVNTKVAAKSMTKKEQSDANRMLIQRGQKSTVWYPEKWTDGKKVTKAGEKAATSRVDPFESLDEYKAGSPLDVAEKREAALVAGIKAFAKKYKLGPIEKTKLRIDARGQMTLLQKMSGTASYVQDAGIPDAVLQRVALAVDGAKKTFLKGQNEMSGRWIKLNHFGWEKVLRKEKLLKEDLDEGDIFRGVWPPKDFPKAKKALMSKATLRKVIKSRSNPAMAWSDLYTNKAEENMRRYLHGYLMKTYGRSPGDATEFLKQFTDAEIKEMTATARKAFGRKGPKESVEDDRSDFSGALDEEKTPAAIASGVKGMKGYFDVYSDLGQGRGATKHKIVLSSGKNRNNKTKQVGKEDKEKADELAAKIKSRFNVKTSVRVSNGYAYVNVSVLKRPDGSSTGYTPESSDEGMKSMAGMFAQKGMTPAGKGRTKKKKRKRGKQIVASTLGEQGDNTDMKTIEKSPKEKEPDDNKGTTPPPPKEEPKKKAEPKAKEEPEPEPAPKKKAPPPPPPPADDEEEEEELTHDEQNQVDREEKGFTIDNVQQYYDAMMLQGVEQPKAITKTKRHFRLKSVKITPAGEVRVPDMQLPKEPPSPMAMMAPGGGAPLPPEEEPEPEPEPAPAGEEESVSESVQSAGDAIRAEAKKYRMKFDKKFDAFVRKTKGGEVYLRVNTNLLYGAPLVSAYKMGQVSVTDSKEWKLKDDTDPKKLWREVKKHLDAISKGA